MMNGLEGMGWGMGLLGLLVLVLVVLGIVALAFFVTGLFASTLHVVPLWLLLGGGGVLTLAALIRPRPARVVQTAAP